MNLQVLPINDAIKKTFRSKFNTPAPIAMSLYGIGLNAAIRTAQTPYLSNNCSAFVIILSEIKRLPLNVICRIGLPNFLPIKCPTNAPDTDVKITRVANHIECCVFSKLIAISNASGGIGLKIDSVKDEIASITSAHGLSAKLRIHWAKSCCNSNWSNCSQSKCQK